MKKYIFLSTLLIITLLSFTACNNNDYEPPETPNYTRHNFYTLGFSVELPTFWKNKVDFHEFETETDHGIRHHVAMHHIATREEILAETNIPDGGWLMTFGKSPYEGYDTHHNPPVIVGKNIILAQTGGNTYFVFFPSGVEHVVNSETSIEYLKITEHGEATNWQFLKNTFKPIN